MLPPAPGVALSADEVAKKERFERAQVNLNDGLKRYEAGNFDDAMKKFLLALDSGILTIPQQINARKLMAFIHCASNRESACKDEFQKILALDAKFDLPQAEAGHPSWGPVFRVVKGEGETRNKVRFPALPAFVGPSVAEKRMSDGMTSYEAGDYNKAIQTFQDALKEPIAETEQIRARKYIAFSYCLTNRGALGRAEFMKILKLKPDFVLDPAEAGHPSWGPSFRAVKSKQKQIPAKK